MAFCSMCGKNIGETAAFCPYCGNKTEVSTQKVTTDTPPATTYTPPIYVPPVQSDGNAEPYTQPTNEYIYTPVGFQPEAAQEKAAPRRELP